jgi:3-methylcrotonyl-CoA carboxylase alpha subunit
MLAKLIVWGEDRNIALRKALHALGEFHVAGVSTNLGFLQALIAHRSTQANAVDTSFIEREIDALIRQQPFGALEMAAAAAAILAEEQGSDPSPWSDQSGWMLAGERKRRVVLRDAHGGAHEAALRYAKRGLLLGAQNFSFKTEEPCIFDISLDGAQSKVFAAKHGDSIGIGTRNGRFRLTCADRFAEAEMEHAAGGHITAPMPGNIIGIHAKTGEILERGQPVLTLEAMKMEHALKASARGKLMTLRCAVGDFVPEGAVLAEFEAIEKE